MCGLVGIVGAAHPAPIAAAVAALGHRGPDAQRAWTGGRPGCRVQLGHARLAVLDPSAAGAQPMWDETNTVAVVFNGAVYNHAALRRDLEARGERFRSRSDTEVILRGYRAFGPGIVARLRGMFALAVWDARAETLLLARDRLGVKPLYWARVGAGLAFASEIKGLAALGVPRAPAPGALDSFLTYLYVPGPGTAFAGVSEVAPAHTLAWTAGAVTHARYWALPATPGRIAGSDADLARQLRALLDEAVTLHAAADVPLGAYLSGGLDSGALVGLLARRSPRPVRTFCLGFGPAAAGSDTDTDGDTDVGADERARARAVAAHFGTDHDEVVVTPDLTSLLPALARHFDQPCGNPTALLAYVLAARARRSVAVVLAGDGGDEVSLGYPRYVGVALAGLYDRAPRALRAAVARWLAPWVPEARAGGRRARAFLAAGACDPADRYARWVGGFTAAQRARLLAPEHRAPTPPEAFLAELLRARESMDAEPVARVANADLGSNLPYNLLTYTDRMAMAHGLEVRVPYCDHVLVEFLAGIPAARRLRGLRTKALFRRAVADVLPPALARGPKRGFTPPLARWLARDLRALVDTWLAPARVRARGVLQPAAVAALVAAHRAGRRDFSRQIWALLALEAWHAHGLAGVGVSSLDADR